MSVYFATAGGYMKIGYSADPIARVGTVTTNGARPADLPRATPATLLGWVPGKRAEESALHRRFAADRIAGEWFRIDPDVIRDLIWSDPSGIDVQRMSALAVLTACKYPDVTREQIEQAGVPVEGAELPLLDFMPALSP